MNGFYILLLFAVILGSNNCQDIPAFRIIAPQNICKPEANETQSAKPSGVTVSFQPRDGIKLTYKVRIFFKTLGTEKFSQRETLLIWKAVRTLETRINMKERLFISKNNMLFINQSELISGVSYIFHIYGITDAGETTNEQIFNIKYVDGVLQNEDVPEGINLLLLGTDTTVGNLIYILHAQITFCNHKHNYSVQWKIPYLNEEFQQIKKSVGSTLIFPANAFLIENHKDNDKNGLIIEATVLDLDTSKTLAKSSIPVAIVSRGFQVIIVPSFAKIGTNRTLPLRLYITNFDSSGDYVQISWEYSTIDAASSNSIQSDNNDSKFAISFSLPGRYKVMAIVSENDIHTKVTAEIEVTPIANINFDFFEVPNMYPPSNQLFRFKVLVMGLVPNCKAGWTSAQEEGFKYISDDEISKQHFGEITISDLAEKYLSEIIDMDSTTVSREVLLNIPITADGNGHWKGLQGDVKYKFRLDVVCPLEHVRAGNFITNQFEFVLHTNSPPTVGNMQIKPVSGFALRTIFQISTSEARDVLFHTPLSYEMHGRFDNHILRFNKYLEYKSWETILPYTQAPIQIFAVICDNQMACNLTPNVTISTSYSEISRIEFDALKIDILAAFARTDFVEAQNMILIAALTFQNANSIHLTDFQQFVLHLLQVEINKLLEGPRNNIYVSKEEIVDFVTLSKQNLEVLGLKDINILENLLEVLEAAISADVAIDDTNALEQYHSTAHLEEMSNNNARQNADISKANQISTSIDMKYVQLKLSLMEDIFSIDENKKPEKWEKFAGQVNSLLEKSCFSNSLIMDPLETPMVTVQMEKMTGVHLMKKKVSILKKHTKPEVGFKIRSKDIVAENIYCVAVAQYPFDFFTNENAVLTHLQIFDLAKSILIFEGSANENQHPTAEIYIESGKRTPTENKCLLRQGNGWSSNSCNVRTSGGERILCLCKHVGYFRLATDTELNDDEVHQAPASFISNEDDVEIVVTDEPPSIAQTVSTLKSTSIEPTVKASEDVKESIPNVKMNTQKGSTSNYLFLILLLVLAAGFAVFFTLLICYRRSPEREKEDLKHALNLNLEIRQRPLGARYATVPDEHTLSGSL